MAIIPPGSANRAFAPDQHHTEFSAPVSLRPDSRKRDQTVGGQRTGDAGGGKMPEERAQLFVLGGRLRKAKNKQSKTQPACTEGFPDG